MHVEIQTPIHEDKSATNVKKNQICKIKCNHILSALEYGYHSVAHKTCFYCHV